MKKKGYNSTENVALSRFCEKIVFCRKEETFTLIIVVLPSLILMTELVIAFQVFCLTCNRQTRDSTEKGNSDAFSLSRYNWSISRSLGNEPQTELGYKV
jgi:hypothetical protein